MDLYVKTVTPIDNLTYERDAAKSALESIREELFAIQSERIRLTNNVFQRLFQRGRINDLTNQENSLLLQREDQSAALEKIDKSIDKWTAVVSTVFNPAKDLERKLEQMAEQDNLFFNDYLEIDVKLNPENYYKYDQDVIQTFDIKDYSIEATIDTLVITYDESFSSIEQFYTKVKEKSGLTQYTEIEQKNLREQMQEVLKSNQFALADENGTFYYFTRDSDSLVQDDRVSFSRMTQDRSTGILEFLLEDNYNSANLYAVKYDERDGTWHSSDIQFSEAAMESLNKMVHADHAHIFGKFYESLPGNERSYINLLNEANRERLDNEYADYISNQSHDKENQLKQFEETLAPEKIHELKNVYHKHVHVGLPVDSPLINMDQLHVVTSKFDPIERKTIADRVSDIYSLGGDFKLGINGNIFSKKENTVEIFEYVLTPSGNEREILGRIPHLTETEARDFMKEPFFYDFEDKFLGIGIPFSTGDPEPIMRVNNLSEALITIGKATNKPRYETMILDAFEYAGRVEEVATLKDEMSKQEQLTVLSDQLKQLTPDQREAIGLEIQQQKLTEEHEQRFEQVFDNLSEKIELIGKNLELVEQAKVGQILRTAASEVGGYDRLEKGLDHVEFELSLGITNQPAAEVQKSQTVEAAMTEQEQRRANMIDRMENKEEVLSLYSNYLSGDRLTYDERTKIVQYDQANGSFEQMQLRLEGLGRAMYRNSDLDLSNKENVIMAARGNNEALQDLISKEYYDMSANERVESRQEERSESVAVERQAEALTETPGFMNYEKVSRVQLEEELAIVQKWVKSYNTHPISERDKDYFQRIELSSGDGNVYYAYPLDDGIDIVDTFTQDVSEILAYKFADQPVVLNDAKTHLFEQLGLSKNHLLEQLAETYGIQNDLAFTPDDYERLFGFPTVRSEKEILASINLQRGEKMVDWVYQGTYSPETVAQYKEEQLVNLQKKLIEGHTLYQIDEQMELVIHSSSENNQSFEGILFKEVGDHETFSANDAKAAAQKLAEMNASPCSKGSMSLFKQFLSDDHQRNHQQHLIQNNIMQETYREETGRSMTGRG